MPTFFKILDEYRKVLEYDQKLITDFYNNRGQGFLKKTDTIRVFEFIKKKIWFYYFKNG